MEEKETLDDIPPMIMPFSESESRLRRRFLLVGGRTRLDREIRCLVVDIVGRAEHDELNAEAKSGLHMAMLHAIERATEDLEERLLHDLAVELNAVPETTRLCLDRATARRELGFD